MGESQSVEEVRHITCTLCEAMCSLEVRLDGEGSITSMRGHEADPLSRGHICPKAFALQDVHEDPDRLRRPVRRTAEGGWREVSWDDAISFAASRLAAVQREHGDDAVAVYQGNPNVHSLGALTHNPTLVRLLHTRNRFSATSVDQLPHQVMAWALYGHQFLLPVPDIDRTDLLVLVGHNPMASNGSLWTVPDFPARRRELAARGGRLVVIDPRRTETAKVADEHHFVRPGSDAAVLLAVVRELLGGDVDALAGPAAYVDGVEAVRAAVEPFTPELAEQVSGMPADAVRGLARDLAAAPSAAVHGRMGVSTQAHGVVCQWAVQTINVLTGNLDRPGGTMFTTPAVDLVGRGVLGPGGFGTRRSRVRGLPSFGGELPVSALEEEISTPGEGQVRALLTIAGNPVSSTPSGHRLDEALEGLDVMVAIDFYVNETTRHADVILPPTGPLERDHYDLDLPPARRARHGPLVTGALRTRAGGPARLGDRPRPRGRPAARACRRAARPVVEGDAADRGAAAAHPAPAARRPAALVGCPPLGGEARGDGGRRRPRPAQAPAARAAHDAREADRPRAAPRARVAAGAAHRAVGGARARRRRAAAHRPSAPARQQLVAAQLSAPHPRAGAARAPRPSRRPRRSRHRRR